MTTIATNRFVVTALPEEVASHVRAHGRDPKWGHPAADAARHGLWALPTVPAEVQGG